MNVKTICLAILTQGNTTGYDIRKRSTEGDFSYFVEASFGSIYPALSKLENNGHVISRVEPQEGRPAKKVYSITPLGKEFFVNSLFEDLNQDVFRSEFLLFLRFAEELPRDLVEKRISQRISDMNEEIKMLEDMCKDFETGKAEQWVLDYALCCLHNAKDYLIKHKDQIIAMAGPADATAEAAE